MSEGIRVMKIGDGGREHSLVWLAGESQLVREVVGWGQNGGICLLESTYRRLSDGEPDFAGIIEAAKRERVKLVMIGPEVPLVGGLVDRLQEAGIPAFGPTQAAANLEGSKWFAKQVMQAAGVPTAPAVRFEKAGIESALQYIKRHEVPVVVKADGLAAGKGAIVCQTITEAQEAVSCCFVQDEFGPAGRVILVEDFLRHHPSLIRAEFSVMALVDIHGNFIMMLPAQDYKPVNDGDNGPNTGGMGAFAPIPWLTQEMMDRVGREIFAPTIAEMKRRGIPFSGVLYAGLIWAEEGPKVIEFNVRFGDPELQVVSVLLETDIIPVLLAIAQGGSIADIRLEWKSGSAVCLVLASQGYPGAYQKGLPIYGMEHAPSRSTFKHFHAGTRFDDRSYFHVTNGGRVLDLVELSLAGLEAAAAGVMEFAGKISFGRKDEPGFGVHYRTDIGRNVPKSIG